jgi:hypothetical protein
MQFLIGEFYGMQIEYIKVIREVNMKNIITPGKERMLFYLVTSLLFIAVVFI